MVHVVQHLYLCLLFQMKALCQDMLVARFRICFSCHLSTEWGSDMTITVQFMRHERSIFKPAAALFLNNCKIAGCCSTNVLGSNSSLWWDILKLMSIYTCKPPTMSTTIKSLQWVTSCNLSAWLDRSLKLDLWGTILCSSLYWDIQLDFEPESPLWVCKHYTLGMKNYISEWSTESLVGLCCGWHGCFMTWPFSLVWGTIWSHSGSRASHFNHHNTLWSYNSNRKSVMLHTTNKQKHREIYTLQRDTGKTGQISGTKFGQIIQESISGTVRKGKPADVSFHLSHTAIS